MWGVMWCGVVFVWRGVAWRGEARRGEAWPGVAWRGVAWCGVAWLVAPSLVAPGLPDLRPPSYQKHRYLHWWPRTGDPGQVTQDR